MKTACFFFLSLFFLTSLTIADDSNGETLDSAFANPTSMTDQQMDNAKEFTHQGIKDRTIKEGCAQKGLNNCSDSESSFPVEEAISKVYALIFGGLMGGTGGPTIAMKSEGTGGTTGTSGGNAGGNSGSGATGGASGEAQEKTSPDYCMYGAMAYEALGGMLQQSLQSKADQSAAASGDIQLQSLVSLKEAHRARRKTAGWQAGVYGTISACYIYMLTWGGADRTDWKIWAKFGGATALTTLYIKKANKHNNSMKKVQKIIDSLPKAGDCNPWTGTQCFCKELTSKDTYPMEYQEVCVLNNGNFDTPKSAVGCGTVADGKLTFDKECKCKQTNSCYKMNLKAYTPNFSLGSNFMDEMNKNIDLLNNGEFDEGKLAQLAANSAAMASRLKAKNVAMPKVNLTAEQKKVADALKPILGANAALAAVSPAASPRGGISDSAALKATSNLGALDEKKVKESVAEAIKMNYQTGSGIAGKSKSNEPTFSFPGLMGQQPASNSTEVLSFAEQAVNKADVSNAPDTPIFDIISNRYRRSGWNKLGPDSEKK